MRKIKGKNKVLLAFDVAVPVLVAALILAIILNRLIEAIPIFFALFICFGLEAVYSRTLLNRKEREEKN